MKKLFILDGAMRPAKPEIIRVVEELEKDSADGLTEGFLIRKITTKNPLEWSDPNDFKEYKPPQEFERTIRNNSGWFTYSYAGNQYGIGQKDLIDGLSKSDNVFVIVRSPQIISRIKEWCGANCPDTRVIVGYIYTDKIAIINTYKKRAMRKEREERVAAAYQDFSGHYCGNNSVYEEFIIFPGTNDPLVKSQITHLVNKSYPYLGIKAKTGFFIHSYQDRNWAEKCANLVKDIAMTLGLSISSLVKANGSYLIDQKVTSALDSVDYIICDITPDRGTEKNNYTSPNVWIELGYALSNLAHRNQIATGKKLLILCEKKSTKNMMDFLKTLTDFQFNVISYTRDEEDEAYFKQVVQENLMEMVK